MFKTAWAIQDPVSGNECDELTNWLILKHGHSPLGLAPGLGTLTYSFKHTETWKPLSDTNHRISVLCQNVGSSDCKVQWCWGLALKSPSTGEMEPTILVSAPEEEPWPFKEDQGRRKCSQSTFQILPDRVAWTGEFLSIQTTEKTGQARPPEWSGLRAYKSLNQIPQNSKNASDPSQRKPAFEKWPFWVPKFLRW